MLAAKWHLIALNNFNPKWANMWMSVFNSRDVKILQLLPFVLNILGKQKVEFQIQPFCFLSLFAFVIPS